MGAQKTTKAVQTKDWSKPVEIVEIPISKISPSQVLVKMLYAPINPSDIISSQGRYIATQNHPLPLTVGFEGTGEVIEVGKDFESKFKPGDKVFYVTLGTWTEYAIVEGDSCHLLPPDAPLDVAACSFINPMTVYLMLLELKAEGHKSVVHTAGSSALGRMFIKVMKENGIKTINLVRNNDYIRELKEIGADYVLNTKDEDFEKSFKDVVALLDCRKVYDAIGGNFTGKLVWLLPNKSNISVYGVLDGDYQVHADFWALLNQESTVSGFSLSTKITNYPKEIVAEGFQVIFAGLKDVFASKVSKVFSLDEVHEAIKYSIEHGSQGKVLLSPTSK